MHNHMRWFRHYLAVSATAMLLIITIGAPALAQDITAPTVDPEVVETDLAEWLDLYNVPGVGYALIQDGEIIQVGGVGVRDTRSDLPVTAETLFPIGSITKSFTTLAVMQLVDAGLLDLDTPVIEYVPQLVLATEEATQSVTLRHLLSHTSGLARADQMLIHADKMTRAESVAAMAEIPINTAPGQTYEYSNQGYMLAGYIVELISGQSWESYVEENIFQPLGMDSAGASALDLLSAENHMLPHQLNLREGMTPIEYFDLGAAGPAGAIIASAQDMAAYMLFQMGDGTFNGQTILSPESMAEMHKMQIAIGADQENTPSLVTNMGYALGWIRFTYRGIDMLSHDGSSNGYYAALTIVPDEQDGVVLLTNAQFAVLFTEVAGTTLIEQLLGLEPERDIEAYINELAAYNPDRVARMMAEVAAYEADPADFTPLLGQYSSVVGELTLFLEDGRLYLRQIVADEPFDFELVPYGRLPLRC
jgi:CubicO group peptidase (beta-lactamase class C family)